LEGNELQTKQLLLKSGGKNPLPSCALAISAMTQMREKTSAEHLQHLAMETSTFVPLQESRMQYAVDMYTL
jgi:hypothetical protein